MRYLLILFLTLSFIGCSLFRQDLVKLSQEEMANADTARVVARNWMTTWQINFGIIRLAFKEIEKQLPCDCFAIIDELDALSLKKPEELTDFDLGRSLYLQFEIRLMLASEAVKKYLPDILKYISAF